MALCRLHKWHCLHNWHWVSCIYSNVCLLLVELHKWQSLILILDPNSLKKLTQRRNATIIILRSVPTSPDILVLILDPDPWSRSFIILRSLPTAHVLVIVLDPDPWSRSFILFLDPNSNPNPIFNQAKHQCRNNCSKLIQHNQYNSRNNATQQLSYYGAYYPCRQTSFL